MKSLTVVAAFSGGLLSFFSPCLLPLLPAYLSFLSGVTVLNRAELAKARIRIFLSALFFTLGFTVVFTLLGAGVGTLGRLFIPYRPLMIKVSGVLIILFGLYMIGFFRLLGLPYFRTLDLSRMRVSGYLGALVLGAAFSFTHGACIGPILGLIFVFASVSGKALIGGLLLAIYSLGLALPFLVLSLVVTAVAPLLRRTNRVLGVVQFVSGVLLIIFGLMVLSGLMTAITARLGPIY